MKYSYTNRKYRIWLEEFVNKNAPDELEGKVNDFLDCLFCVPFIWTIPMDENREKDGLVLRQIFSRETKVFESKVMPDSPCTVLEVILSLAIRMEETLYRPKEDHISDYFWEMIENTNWIALFLSDKREMLRSIERWLVRDFEENGVGGLFPLSENSEIDQRNLEIWYQMNSYILENYRV